MSDYSLNMGMNGDPNQQMPGQQQQQYSNLNQPFSNQQFSNQPYSNPPQYSSQQQQFQNQQYSNQFSGQQYPNPQQQQQQQPPFQNQNQNQNQNQQQPQQPFNPNLLSNLDSNVATQLGMAYGTHAFQAGQTYFNSNIQRYIDIPMLKYYFDVSNSYVGKKLGLIVFPFKKREWEREMKKSSDLNTSQFLPPRDDLNAPDLYIPVMAFITFILLFAIQKGQQNEFTPEVLGVTASSGMVVTILEIVLIKLGCYIFSIPSELGFLDLIAYTGYKYVGMILALFTSILLGSHGFFFIFFYTSIALVVFLLRILRPNFGTYEVRISGQVDPQRTKRNYFLLAISFMQVASAYILL